jgi:RNA polymerase sigma-70 factor (ECF subfamily)
VSIETSHPAVVRLPRCESSSEFNRRADALERTRSQGPSFRRRGQIADESGDVDVIARAVALAKEGDGDAVRYLYVRFGDAVYTYVSTIVNDPHEAEDVTQQVFAKLLTVLPKYEERESVFAAWLLRVARNAAIDHLRHLRAVPCDDIWPDGHEGAADARERSLVLREALAELPPEQCEVVVLRHVVGLSPSEIADRLQKTESSVHGLHHRGRGALRAGLASVGFAPATQSA